MMVSTKAARIRIGRVTMKNGGADVRVLHRDQHPSPIAQHLRAWTDDVLTSHDAPPDGYAAIAYWVDDATPGRPQFHPCYFTRNHALPTVLLVQMAGQHLLHDVAARLGMNGALDAIGVCGNEWSPDDGAS